MAVKFKSKKKAKKSQFFSRWRQQIGYALNNMSHNFRHNFFTSILTILVISITMTLPTVGYVLLKNSYMAAEQWHPTPNLTAYLDRDLSDTQIFQLIEQIEQDDQVGSLTYLSKDDALREFLAWSGFDETMDMLDENPLPPVLIIEPKDEYRESNALRQIKSELSTMKGVDEVKLDDSWFARVMALANMVKMIVWGVSILMIIAVILVISNSIRLMIFARRQTISVMELMGATEGFIFRPFLYSGMLTGFISSIIAIIFTEIFIYQIAKVIGNISSIFQAEFQFSGLSFEETLLILFSSVVIGWVAAFFATKRFLNNKALF